jgi:hypothetical protein
MPTGEKYSFNSVQTHLNVHDGHMEEVTESVSVRNGKGTKSVRIRRNNQVKTAKHKLSPVELKNIKNKNFMPNLFTPCHGDCAKGKSASLTAALAAPLMRNKKTQKKKPTKK